MSDETPPPPTDAGKSPEPAVEEFPEKLYCPQCRRVFPVKAMRAKSNTLLTEAALVCPRCRRKLRRMKLKDWYDHYVQGQTRDFAMDSHGFVHQNPPGMEPPGPPERPQPQGPRTGRGQDPRQQRKDSRLPREIRSYRLPKRRRSGRK